MSEEIKQSPAAPEPPGAASASAEAPAAADAPSPAMEPRCKCGAGPHAEREGFCANSHPFKGHGGRLSLKHGLYAERSAADAVRADAVFDSANPRWRYDWQREVFVDLGDRLSALVRTLRGSKVSAVKVAMQMVREWNQLDADLRASEAQLPPLIDEAESLTRVAQLAQRFPREWVEMHARALADDPGLAPILRAALDAHDARPQGQPEPVASAVPPVLVGRPRARADADDEVIL